MVRQYIGARYVPKFYEHNGSNNWRANESYEALTIVTYNNDSYTSKKVVPANIGNPAANSEYWALTGNYNSQIEQYREDVFNMENGYILNKKIAVLGDSIAKGDHSNGGLFKRFEDNFDCTVKNYAKNGAYMVHGVTNNLSDQFLEMQNEGFVPDIYVFMFHFNEISHAESVMTSENSIGFPQNNDRYTSIGNLEYWINNIYSNNPDARIIYLNYPIAVAQNPRSFFNAQFEYGLYMLGKIYSIPVIDLNNTNITFSENVNEYTVDGLHFNSKYIDYVLFPYVKKIFTNGFAWTNTIKDCVIGLFGEQTNIQNYITALDKLSNTYRRKWFASNMDCLCFYTQSNTTDTTVRFFRALYNYNQLFGSFGLYYKPDTTTLVKFNKYGNDYNETVLLKPLVNVTGTRTANISGGAAKLLSDSDAIKLSATFTISNSASGISFGTKTVLPLFTFTESTLVKILENRLYELGKCTVNLYSNNETTYFDLGIYRTGSTLTLCIIGGAGTYSSMKSGGAEIKTCYTLPINEIIT